MKIDPQKLPLKLTAKEIRQYLWNCSSTTVRMAYKNGKIKGTPISSRRILYETDSVLQWLGLAPVSPPPETPVAQLEGPQPRLPLPGRTNLKAAREKALQSASEPEAY